MKELLAGAAKLETACRLTCHVALLQLCNHSNTVFSKYVHTATVLCLPSLLDVCAHASNYILSCCQLSTALGAVTWHTTAMTKWVHACQPRLKQHTCSAEGASHSQTLVSHIQCCAKSGAGFYFLSVLFTQDKHVATGNIVVT